MLRHGVLRGSNTNRLAPSFDMAEVFQNPYRDPTGQTWGTEAMYRRGQMEPVRDKILEEGRSSGLSQAQYYWLKSNGFDAYITPDMLRESSKAWFQRPQDLSYQDYSAFNDKYLKPAGFNDSATIANIVGNQVMGAVGGKPRPESISQMLASGQTPEQIVASYQKLKEANLSATNPADRNPEALGIDTSQANNPTEQQLAAIEHRPYVPGPAPAPAPIAGRTPPPGQQPGAPIPGFMPAVPQYNANQQARVNQLNTNSANVFGAILPSTVTIPGQKPMQLNPATPMPSPLRVPGYNRNRRMPTIYG